MDLSAYLVLHFAIARCDESNLHGCSTENYPLRSNQLTATNNVDYSADLGDLKNTAVTNDSNLIVTNYTMTGAIGD